jgi:hypothetical protein
LEEPLMSEISSMVTSPNATVSSHLTQEKNIEREIEEEQTHITPLHSPSSSPHMDIEKQAQTALATPTPEATITETPKDKGLEGEDGSKTHEANTGKESWNRPRHNVARLATVYLAFLNFGLNDASFGVSFSDLFFSYSLFLAFMTSWCSP